jgi:UDP-N-acetylglucosamine--N-acetylmuramyl-(pentapeptide) pyrophosphoryl-undecaprenol N-acetylglucosamine transferase
MPPARESVPTATGGYLIAGGGTGGHVFPALALAGELAKRRPGAPIVFVGTARGLETELVPRAGYPLELVRAKGLVGKSPGARASGAAALPLGMADSWRILSRHLPRAVVGVGGYASGPVLATAWARRFPTVVHESNAVPGLTNRLLAKVATKVAVGTEAALERLPGATVVGNPVRAEFFAIPPLDARPADRTLRVLVVGGSQGAQILNRVLPEAMRAVAARGLSFQLLHQSGRARPGIDPGALRAAYGSLARVEEFLHDVAAEIATADLLVARAGAMTTAEIAASGRPALLIPFAAATHGHQEANARALERAGAAVVLLESEATPARVAEVVASLLEDPARLAAMGRAARSVAKPDAAARFCDLVLSVERPQ